MGRPPCCDESGVKKGPWTPEEDQKLIDYISKHGHGSWRTLPKHAGLNRCGKSCRLRWSNYLRPDIKRGKFTEEEERVIINLHSVLGNKWSKIAAHLPGRTDNEIKNFWNTHIRKKLLQMGIDPETHKPRTDFNQLMNLTQLLGMSNSLGNSTSPWGNNPLGLQIDVTDQLTKIQLLQNLLHIVNMNPYLLGNHSLNPLQLEAFVNNGTIPSIHNKEAFLRGQEYANPGLVPQAQSEDISKVWTDHVEGGSSLEGSCFNNQNQSEMALPALVSASGTVNQMESGCKTAQASTSESPSSSIFEAWEKLLDDETSGSDWKDILELSSTLASPISW